MAAQRGPRKGKWNYFTDTEAPVTDSIFGGTTETVEYRWRQVGGKKTGYEEFQRQVRESFDLDYPLDTLIERMKEFRDRYEDAYADQVEEGYPYESNTYRVNYLIGWEPVSVEDAKEAWERQQAKQQEKEQQARQFAERQLARIRQQFPDMVS